MPHRGKRTVAGPALVAVVLLAAAVAGYAGWRRWAGDGDKAAVRLWATVEQHRTDEVRRTVQIALRNDGPLPVRITEVELLAPSFSGITPVATDTALPADGQRVDIRIPYGTGRCVGAGDDDAGAADTGEPAADTGEPAAVVLRVRTADGRERPVRLELPYPDELLDRLLAADCRAAWLAAIVTVGFDGWSETAGGALRGSLVVERLGSAAPVTVHDLEGSVVYRITPDPSDRPRPLTVLDPTARRASVPVLVDAARCSGHALGETKKPFVFPIWVSVGPGAALYSTITVSPADEVTLRQMVDRRCAGQR